MKLPILLLTISSAFCGFTEYQSVIVRAQMTNHLSPPTSSISDAILIKGEYAFTDQALLVCRIDAARFQCCPNSFANTIIHEIHHLNGRQHNQLYVKDDPMSYSLTTRANGEILEDNYVFAPLTPTQPWAAPIYAKQQRPATPAQPSNFGLTGAVPVARSIKPTPFPTNIFAAPLPASNEPTSRYISMHVRVVNDTALG